MKHVIWILLLLPMGLSARICKVSFGPALKEVKRDAAILVEACDCPPGTLAELDRATPAWLASEQGDTVPMRLVLLENTLVQQALLRPARPLRAGDRYGLHIPGLLDRADVDALLEVRWEVRDELEESRVGFLQQPKSTMGAKLSFGEVAHRVERIDFQPLDSAVYFARVQVEDVWMEKSTTWLAVLAPGQDFFSVGWPLRDCGPGMELVAGVTYRVSLTLYGADGVEGRTSDPFQLLTD